MGAGATVKPENPRYIALNTAAGVKRLLADYNALSERRFTGDTSASDILIDLETAVKLAKLTARQAEALRLVYVEDLTQAKAGERLGIGQDVVSYHLDKAAEEIAEIYYFWTGHGEGYGGEAD